MALLTVWRLTVYRYSKPVGLGEHELGVTSGGGSTHAWMQVYLPGAGWVDFDPTNSIRTRERQHVIRVPGDGHTNQIAIADDA